VDNQERHYHINKLNVIFALSSVTLLIAVGWMLMDDYSRTWKNYQKDFRTLEIEKTRIKYDTEFTTLEEETEYQELIQQFEKAKNEYEANCSEITDKYQYKKDNTAFIRPYFMNSQLSINGK